MRIYFVICVGHSNVICYLLFCHWITSEIVVILLIYRIIAQIQEIQSWYVHCISLFGGYVDYIRLH